MSAEPDPTAEPFVRLGNEEKNAWRTGNGSSAHACFRFPAANAYAARTDPRVPAAYSEHPENPGLYASAIEAQLVPDSPGFFDVLVNWTPRQSGSTKPQNPQPGDEYWEVSSVNETTKVYYGLGPPDVKYGENAIMDSGTVIGLNANTGEVTGCDIQSGGLAISLTQYRSGSETKQDFVLAIANARNKVNSDILFGFPPGCVLLSDIQIQRRQSGVTPVVYVFLARSQVDLSEIRIVDKNNQPIPLSGLMSGYDYLDLMTGETTITVGGSETKLYYTLRAQIHKIYHKSDFAELGISKELR